MGGMRWRRLRALFGWRTPPGWSDTSIRMTSREGFALAMAEGRVDMTVDFVPFRDFGADAVVQARSARVVMIADGSSRPLSPGQQQRAIQLVREFLEYNGQRVRVE